jgi:hypothetical protein
MVDVFDVKFLLQFVNFVQRLFSLSCSENKVPSSVSLFFCFV